jgi:hypothetical protein
MDSEYAKSASKGDEVQTTARSTDEVAVDEKYGTQHDGLDMERMGKLQQLRVRFLQLPSLYHRANTSSPSETSDLCRYLVTRLFWVALGNTL